MTKRLALTLLLTFLAVAPALAQHTIFLVRHAERADSKPTAGSAPTMMAADPDLSAAGHARAQSLAAALADAKITAIFTTELKRTQQTAAPLAKALALPVTVVNAKDAADLLARLKSSTGNVLVVGHSNTVPDIIKGLGVTPAVTIGDDEFDNLFLVTPGATPSLLRLHYR